MLSYLPPLEALHSHRTGGASKTSPLLPETDGDSRPYPVLTALIVASDPGFAEQLLECLAASAPKIHFNVVADYPRGNDFATAKHPPSALLIALSDFLPTQAASPHSLLSPESPALVIIHPLEQTERAETLLKGGAQACVAEDQLPAVDWDRLIRQADKRQQYRRSDRFGESCSATGASTDFSALLPLLLWQADASGKLERLDDGSIFPHRHPRLIELEPRLVAWVLAGRENGVGIPPGLEQLIEIEDGARTRAFVPLVRRIPGAEPARWLLALVEATEIALPLREGQSRQEAVAHALRTPLTSIVMSARLAVEAGSGECQAEMWKIVLESANDLQATLDQHFGSDLPGIARR